MRRPCFVSMQLALISTGDGLAAGALVIDFQLPDGSIPEANRDLMAVALDVVSDRPLGHMSPHDFAQGPMAADADVLVVGVQHPARLVEHQVPGARGLDQVAILRLAFGEGLLGLSALGDVAEEAGHADASAVS